jgi:hypothetical protein
MWGCRLRRSEGERWRWDWTVNFNAEGTEVAEKMSCFDLAEGHEVSCPYEERRSKLRLYKDEAIRSGGLRRG